MTTDNKQSKDELLIRAAETIGSTLGAIAAKAEAATKGLTGRKIVRKAEQVTKALSRGKLASRLGMKRNARRKSSASKSRSRNRTQARRGRRPAHEPPLSVAPKRRANLRSPHVGPVC